MRIPRLMQLEILTTFLVVLLQQNGRMVESFGYSYSRFIGPVRGPERQIIVHDRYDGRGRVDYVARPEYHFAYGVEDAKTRVLQNHRETRNGDAVKGVYSVVDPDGSLRVVKYTADNVNGFQAEVISNGVSSVHGQDNPVVHPPQLVEAVGDGNQVNGKDNENPHYPPLIQVQHPEEEEVGNVHEVVESETGPDEVDDVDDTKDDSSSSSKGAGDYDEKDGESAEQEESDEEVEDY